MPNRVPHTGHFGEHFGNHFGFHFGGLVVNDYFTDPVQPDGPGRTGVDQPQYSGAAYPFVSTEPNGMFLEDLQVSLTGRDEPELYLAWASGVGIQAADTGIPAAVHRFDLQLRNLAGNVVVDTRDMDAMERHWAGDVWVYSYRDGEKFVSAVVRHDPMWATGYLFQHALVDHRAIVYRPRGLEDLLVRRGEQYQSALRTDGQIEIRAGYNFELSSSRQVSPRGERIAQLDLAVQPGAGLGRFPGCDANVGITAIGRARPEPNGELLLGGDDCLSVRPQLNFEANLANVLPGRFVISDACQAACQCSDFLSVVQFATATWNRYVVLAERLKYMRDQYHELREEILAWHQCALENPLRVHHWPASPCGIGIGVGVCNGDDECLTAPEIEIRVKDNLGNPVNGTLDLQNLYRVEYTGKVAYPVPTEATYDEPNGVYHLTLPDVAPGQMGFAFLRIDLDECDQQGNVEVTLANQPASWVTSGPASKAFNFTGRSRPS